jgi:ABC-2 type transport system permease protein
MKQTWLVAVREMIERARSRAFQISLAVMVLVIVGVIVAPSLITSGNETKDVGLSGSAPAELSDTIEHQGAAVGTTVKVHTYDTLAAGEDAVRSDDVDVLVVDATRLEWRKHSDDELRAVVTSAIQLVTVRERAEAAGISPDELIELVAPVPLDEVEIGSVAGRSPDDETAAMLMTVLLFIAISTYGNLVLAGVVEEKASRVVEVLLARMPARRLLAGKVGGIGLLGLAQFGVTAVAAVIALNVVDSIDVPAARGAVIAWVVVWFVLGYALYATVYGALGALASRPEDAQSVAGPLIMVLIAGYFASFATIGKPDSGVAQILSFVPATAPLSMPGRIAMGATSWWEPLASAALTVAAKKMTDWKAEKTQPYIA